METCILRLAAIASSVLMILTGCTTSDPEPSNESSDIRDEPTELLSIDSLCSELNTEKLVSQFGEPYTGPDPVGGVLDDSPTKCKMVFSLANGPKSGRFTIDLIPTKSSSESLEQYEDLSLFEAPEFKYDSLLGDFNLGEIGSPPGEMESPVVIWRVSAPNYVVYGQMGYGGYSTVIPCETPDRHPDDGVNSELPCIAGFEEIYNYLKDDYIPSAVEVLNDLST
ncbi:hypothetical protein [Salininema proteolyticum]|uniref:Uncharacterized protein n=1 Tax=Salininema proteolyticum TaxID=1607685 RepID=A0ABV8TVW7_9ACTN